MQNITSHPAKGAPLQEAYRRQLAEVVRLRGERSVRAYLGISCGTLSRCLAGLSVYPGTRALIAQKLGTMVAEAT